MYFVSLCVLRQIVALMGVLRNGRHVSYSKQILNRLLCWRMFHLSHAYTSNSLFALLRKKCTDTTVYFCFVIFSIFHLTSSRLPDPVVSAHFSQSGQDIGMNRFDTELKNREQFDAKNQET